VDGRALVSAVRVFVQNRRTSAREAAVLSGGFTGLSLGSTPTAIACMSAITRNYGSAPNAFIILPLVSAFFVDIVNVAAISLFLKASPFL